MLTRTGKNEMLRMETRAKFPFLIEIKYYSTNGNLTDDNGDKYSIYRYANSDNDIVFNENTYYASYFEIELPQETTNGVSDAKITISAIDQSWIQKIRETGKRSQIKFIAVIMFDSTIEPIEEMDFELTSVTWNDVSIQWTMEFDNLMDIQIPIETIDERICPALA